MRGIDHRRLWGTLCRWGLGSWWLSALMGCMPVGGGLAVFPLEPPPRLAQPASPAPAAVASGRAAGAYAGAAACTAEPRAALASAIDEVPGRAAHDALLVAWRRVDDVSAAGSETLRRSSLGLFLALCDRLERHGDLEAEQAGRLKVLAVCVADVPEG